MSSGWSRIAPVLGILAVALIVAAFIIGGEPPDADAPGSEVVSYYAENDTETGVASTLLAVGASLYVLFFALLAATLRRAETGVSALSIAVIGGAIMTGIGMLVFAGIGFTLSDVGADLEPAATQALHALNMDLFFPVAGGTVVLSWALALSILRNGGLPRWLGWFAIVIAVAALTPAGFFAFLALGIWTLVASVVLLTRPETPEETAARLSG